jgi:hypothetical protein
MKRTCQDHLVAWLNSDTRKPLLIRGARQVGKSTLVRLFARAQGLSLCEVNCERHRKLESVFATMDPTAIRREIEITLGTQIADQKTLLFIDEIQAIPEAIQSLRYFYEEMPDLPLVAAGSLLEFALQKKSFSMPVGRVEYLYIGPMSFEEFLDACGEDVLLSELRGYRMGSAFSAAAHERLCALTRDYYFVGGLPAAVLEYSKQRSTAAVVAVHDSILETYRDDFGKYATGKEVDRLQRLFDALSGAVTGGKFRYVNALPEEQPREVRSALMMLAKAGVATLVHHASCSGLPLAAGTNDRIFKLLMLDVGLLHASLGVHDIPASVLQQRNLLTEGRAAEQFIGQHLLYCGTPHRRPTLHYWLREGRSSNAEVDFVLTDQGRIIPVEVKSGRAGALRSLHQFVAEKAAGFALRFDLNPPSVQDIAVTVSTESGAQQIAYRLLSLPHYMVGQALRVFGETFG